MYAGVCECVFIPLVACVCLAAAGGQSYLASRCGTSSALKKKRDCFRPTVIFMHADGIQRNSAGSCCVSAADEVWWMAVQSSVESRREKFLILYCSIVHFLFPLVFFFIICLLLVRVRTDCWNWHKLKNIYFALDQDAEEPRLYIELCCDLNRREFNGTGSTKSYSS